MRIAAEREKIQKGAVKGRTDGGKDGRRRGRGVGSDEEIRK